MSPALRLLLALLTTGLLLTPLSAFAVQSDEDDGDDDEVEQEEVEQEPFDDEVDTREIYEEFKADLAGEGAVEESESWARYLDAYPKSIYRLTIERRIEALQEAAYAELAEEKAQDEAESATRVDAKDQELDVREPALVWMGPNTRRRVEAGVLWGFNDYLNYQIGLEWALLRRLSVFGMIQHTGVRFGGALQAGVKGALVKDVRTGIVLSGAFSIQVGYAQQDLLNFWVEPWVGFAWIASDSFQIQTSAAFQLRLDRIHTNVVWDVMAVFTPSPIIDIYIESKQKHSLLPVEGLGNQYLAFYQAGAGVKIHPTKTLDITVGANVPYFWRHWKDYQYFGVHVGMNLYFAKGPLK